MPPASYYRWLVYDELRKLAAHKMSQEKAGQTLQPTALVHEAFMRLIGNSLLAPNDRLEAYPTKELTGGTLL